MFCHLRAHRLRISPDGILSPGLVRAHRKILGYTSSRIDLICSIYTTAIHEHVERGVLSRARARGREEDRRRMLVVAALAPRPTTSPDYRKGIRNL
jgi:hypothetical protein